MSRIDPRPEIRCTINDFITRDYLVFAMKRKEAVHGKIVRIFVREKLVVVFLGNGLYGILSLVSILLPITPTIIFLMKFFH